jgi:hypothetical protein
MRCDRLDGDFLGMKRLIVLLTLVSLLACSVGCRCFRGRRMDRQCGTPGYRTLSLPWRQAPPALAPPPLTPACESCGPSVVTSDPIISGPIHVGPMSGTEQVYGGETVFQEPTVVPGPEVGTIP